MDNAALQREIMTRFSAALPTVLYGPNGKPLGPTSFQYSRPAAARSGSMIEWNPKPISGWSAANERERIVERSIELCNSDPHASGIVDTFATTAVGSGLNPFPLVDKEALGIDKDQARALQLQQRIVYRAWAGRADSAGQLTFGEIQALCYRSAMEFGEFFVLLPMIQVGRKYALTCQVIHPLRVRTPSDYYSDKTIIDGVRIGRYGAPISIFIKKSGNRYKDNSSANFYEVPVSRGGRPIILHGFFKKEPEQYRGYPVLAPVMKMLKDFHDLVDAELVSSVVTAAFSLFIESAAGTDPSFPAINAATLTEYGFNADGNAETIRYEGFEPGQVLYGNPGEKPQVINPNRPGATFAPFIKTLKDSISGALGMHPAVTFKQMDGLTFAAGRLAWLDAWRVFTRDRTWLVNRLCQPVYTALIEEAWLRRDIDYQDFYAQPEALTNCDWRGAPKGNIEPIQDIKADVIAIENNLKTRSQRAAEQGEDWQNIIDTLAEEKNAMDAAGLIPLGPNEPQDKQG